MKAGRIVLIILLLEISMAALTMYGYGNGPSLQSLQLITRLSGIFTLIIFSILFQFRNTRIQLDVLLLQRPYVAFATALSFYACILGLYFYLAALPVEALRTIGVLIFYGFALFMPRLVVQNEKHQLSARTFGIVEKIFLYYAWLIFFMTYLPRVRGISSPLGGSYREQIILLGWVSLLLGMKITSLLIPPARSTR